MAPHTNTAAEPDVHEVAFVFSFNIMASAEDAIDDCADALAALSWLLANTKDLDARATRGLNCMLSGIAATMLAANDAIKRAGKRRGRP